jgi:predicted DNA-binding transcriptional regulator AlpA
MNGSNSDRRTTADRREMERRRVNAQHALVGGAIRTADARRLEGPSTSTLEPILKLSAAVDALAARLSENAGRNTERPTCTVDEAAALLGTTAKGIYALHERGKLPRSIGPGRRLVFLREELLQLARRASPSGGNGR